MVSFGWFQNLKEQLPFTKVQGKGHSYLSDKKLAEKPPHLRTPDLLLPQRNFTAPQLYQTALEVRMRLSCGKDNGQRTGMLVLGQRFVYTGVLGVKGESDLVSEDLD